MRILLLHNKYQQAGGEDKVFESEGELLSSNNNVVERLVFDNKDIATVLDKALSGIMSIYNFRSAKLLEQKIIEFKPDIIHVHNFLPLASPSIFFIAKRNKIPVVLTLHNYRLICPSSTLFYNGRIYEKSIHSLFPLDAILKGVYRDSILQTAGVAVMVAFHNIIGTWKNKVDKFIVLTEFARSKFRESALRVADDQFVLKPNFITDPGKSEYTRDSSYLFVGRLSAEKGIDVLLNAFKRSDFKLTIVGDGPMRDQVEACAGERSNIEYLGFQPRTVIIDRLKRCRCLLFPSIWFEGFPITILEAFATGTPVIGSRLGGVAEIVVNKSNGLHFEPGSEEGLIRAINDLHQMDFETLSGNARKTYEEYYTPERNYNILMDIYKSAMNPN
jgi:glycosyltransferase involved in cell wall biosynthesis